MSNCQNLQTRGFSRKGFSLVELLVVIAVIGILAAIAIPLVSNLQHKSLLAKDQRNAQNLAVMAAAAKAAGASLPGGPDLKEVVSALSEGIQPALGSLSETTYRVPNLSPEDQEGAIEHLEWDVASECIIYKPKF